jgi:Mce-associated membrane protein
VIGKERHVPSQQPPSRRRPVPAPAPTRRPRVAGLRHPEARPTDEPDTNANESTQVIPKVPAEPEPVAEPAVDQPVADQPKPAGKRRPRPTPKPVESTAELPRVETAELPRITDEQDEIDDEPVAARRSGLLLPVVLAVVAVLVGGLAAWFGVQWNSTRGDNTNTALTDSATTSEVSGQVTSAVNTIFSYDYTNLAKTRTAVQRLLTGNALCQYNLLYKDLQQQAPSQKLVLTTTVQDKGVELLQGGTARVLLLVQQHDTRATTNQTSDSQSMIAVNAIKQGGTWKINSIDTFSGTSPTAGCKS